MVYSNSGYTRSAAPDGRVEWRVNSVVATTDSSTDPAASQIIRNSGDISALAAVLIVTKGGGTTPTASLTLQGSMDPDATTPTWVTAKGAGGTDMACTASDIATAATNNIVQSLSTGAFGVKNFPFKAYRFVNDLAGTNPTWEGKIHDAVERQPGRNTL